MPFADIPPQPPMTVAAPVALRLTAERVQVSDGATMGLAGLHYLRPLGDVASGATPAAAGGCKRQIRFGTDTSNAFAGYV